MSESSRMSAECQRILITDARLDGTPVDVRIVGGLVREVGDLPAEVDDFIVPAYGGEVITGLHDHHLHVLAAAARQTSVSLRGTAGNIEGALLRIREAVSRKSEGDWIRVVELREDGGTPLSRELLDTVAPHNPVRVQDATGGMWVLNSQALSRIPSNLLESRLRESIEIDESGAPTGRLHRLDAELATLWPETDVDIRGLGEELLRFGITGITDATPTTDPVRIGALTAAQKSGDLPQDVHILSGRKIVLSDHALPSLEELCSTIESIHASELPIAIHTVTLESALLACHALTVTGTVQGDRLEHVAVSTPEVVRMVADLDLRVVTQPGFIADRGEHYRRMLTPVEHDELYRYRSFLDAGVRVAPSSDHPFGPLDPWHAIRAATYRRTERGKVLAGHESVDPSVVLRGYQSPLQAPGSAAPSVRAGVPADLCVLTAPLTRVFHEMSRDEVHCSPPVAAVVIGSQLWQFHG